VTTGWIRAECCYLEIACRLDVESFSFPWRWAPPQTHFRPLTPACGVGAGDVKAGRLAGRLTRVPSLSRYERHNCGLNIEISPSDQLMDSAGSLDFPRLLESRAACGKHLSDTSISHKVNSDGPPKERIPLNLGIPLPPRSRHAIPVLTT